MNVLVVSPKFHPVIGGGETFVLNSLKKLHELGWQVGVACEPNSNRDATNYPFKVYELAGLSDDSLALIPAVDNFYKLVQAVKPDIIHVHGYFALLVAGLGNPTDIPIIASIHSTPVWGERIIGGMSSFEAELAFARRVIQLAKPRLLTAANAVYAQAAEKVVAGSVEVVTLPYPVDINFFSQGHGTVLREQFGLTPNSQLILTPSRIIRRKGIKEIVLALGKLPDNYYLCLPAASKPLDPSYWQEICAEPAYQKLKHRIFIPEQPVLYDAMPDVYAASDIIAMPSYYEGAPVATVEAMASGKPFVGADSQGITSFIHHHINGLLVPQKDSSELAAAILQLSQDKALQARLSQQALKDITPLSWEQQLPQLTALYADIYEKETSSLSSSAKLDVTMRDQ